MAAKRDIHQLLKRYLPVVGLIVGLAILLAYPASEAFDAWRRSQAAAQLDQQSTKLTDPQKQELLTQAHAYNRKLAGLTPEGVAQDQVWPYNKQLSPDGHDTAFGYVLIPRIGLTMPVFHGTSKAVLSAGVGHLEGSSLPVGGATTHAVLSAHSGMENMRAFDDIRLLKQGDVFGVRVLGDLYTYKVTSTEVVLPDQVDSIQIQSGKDLMTLVTCTPYGVNDHRLLVHGERCPVPKGFLEEKPSVGEVLSNRRMWPAVAGVSLAAALAIGAGVRHVRRHRARGAAGSKGASVEGAGPDADAEGAESKAAETSSTEIADPAVEQAPRASDDPATTTVLGSDPTDSDQAVSNPTDITTPLPRLGKHGAGPLHRSTTTPLGEPPDEIDSDSPAKPKGAHMR